MHYLIISSEFPPGPGGIGKHAWSMAKALVHNGVQVDVVSNMDHAEEAAIASFLNTLPQGMKVYRVKRQGVQTYINRLRAIERLCRDNKYDKIIVTGQFSLWIGGWLKRSGKQVTSFVHGTELYIGGAIKRMLTRNALKSLDEVYAVSNYTAGLTEQIIHKKVKVLPNGLDLSEWDYQGIGKLNWKGDPLLLTVGSVTTRKGQHNVVCALPALLKEFPNLHYHLVGLPKEADAIWQLAKDLQVENYITIHGQAEEQTVKAAYKKADVLMMLSEQAANGDVEGFGIAVLEANINGKPAIGSKGTGIEDAIKDGYNGKLVDAKDPQAIVKAMKELRSADRELLAENCVNWARQYDWEQLAKQLV